MRATFLPLGFALFLSTAVHAASLLDSVNKAVGGSGTQSGTAASSGSLLDSVGGLSIPSMQSVGTENATGVLQYCIKNNYLGGDSGSVAGKLTSLLGGQKKAEASPDYQAGLSGILGGKSDQKVDLSASGLKAKATEKVCEKVLEYGKSLL